MSDRKEMRSDLLLGIDIHLTLLTIELQSESLPVGKNQVEGLSPLRLTASALHTKAQRIAQTMAALHQQGLRVTSTARGMLADVRQMDQLEGRLNVGQSLLLV